MQHKFGEPRGQRRAGRDARSRVRVNAAPVCCPRLQRFVRLVLIAPALVPHAACPPRPAPPCSILFITACLGFALRVIPLVPLEFAAGLTLVREGLTRWPAGGAATASAGAGAGAAASAAAAAAAPAAAAAAADSWHCTCCCCCRCRCRAAALLPLLPAPVVPTPVPLHMQDTPLPLLPPAVCCGAHHPGHWRVPSADLQGQRRPGAAANGCVQFDATIGRHTTPVHVVQQQTAGAGSAGGLGPLSSLVLPLSPRPPSPPAAAAAAAAAAPRRAPRPPLPSPRCALRLPQSPPTCLASSPCRCGSRPCSRGPPWTCMWTYQTCW